MKEKRREKEAVSEKQSRQMKVGLTTTQQWRDEDLLIA